MHARLLILRKNPPEHLMFLRQFSPLHVYSVLQVKCFLRIFPPVRLFGRLEYATKGELGIIALNQNNWREILQLL